MLINNQILELNLMLLSLIAMVLQICDISTNSVIRSKISTLRISMTKMKMMTVIVRRIRAAAVDEN